MTQSRHVFLIVNGKAANRTDLHLAVAETRARGHRIDVRVTFEPADIDRFVDEFAACFDAGRASVLAAGGGDGTLNAVLSSARRTGGLNRFTFGVVPLGTANDFARGQSIPTECLSRALTLCAGGTGHPIDLGRINDRVFVNLASGGSLTRITHEADPRMKRVLGGAAYLVEGARRLGDIAPVTARFSADGFSWSGQFLVMAIGNGPMAGGGLALCPDARIDDGYLDLTILPKPEVEDMPSIVSQLIREGGERLPETAVQARIRHLTIESADPLSVNLDGEPMSSTCLDVGLLPERPLFVRPL